MLNELSEKIYEANKLKGFYESDKNIGEMLALFHSEVSEALLLAGQTMRLSKKIIQRK